MDNHLNRDLFYWATTCKKRFIFFYLLSPLISLIFNKKRETKCKYQKMRPQCFSPSEGQLSKREVSMECVCCVW